MLDYHKLNNYQIYAVSMAAVLVVIVTFIIFVPTKFGNQSKVVVDIEEGSSLRNIGQILKDLELIRSKNIFVFYIMAVGEEGGLKAGSYNLSRSMSIHRIAITLAEGVSKEREIIIPEGFNIWEIDQRLVEHGVIREGEFSSRFYKDEGYLFPDTYRFELLETGSSELKDQQRINEIGQRMKNNFNSRTRDLFSGLSQDEVERAVIVASILEKEVHTKEEMRTVAGIIENRIELGIPLQIDATVSYGACLREFIESSFTENCDISFIGVAKEIQIDSEFNSYKREELPLSPISNPGLAALEAALDPLETNYLYYLSPRGSRTTIFSESDTEHTTNRRKYLGL